MTRPTEPPNSELLATCRYIDIGDVFDRLSAGQIKTILLATEAHRLESMAFTVLVPEGYNLADLASSPDRVPPSASIAANDLDRFLHDSALHDLLNRGEPVVVVLQAFEDWLRLRSILAALPLPDDEARLDPTGAADWDEADEADEARCNHDYEHDCDDEPDWDDGESAWGNGE
jgi:hypothetical protein